MPGWGRGLGGLTYPGTLRARARESLAKTPTCRAGLLERLGMTPLQTVGSAVVVGLPTRPSFFQGRATRRSCEDCSASSALHNP